MGNSDDYDFPIFNPINSDRTGIGEAEIAESRPRSMVVLREIPLRE
jgi:hypothetical protein